MVLVGKCSGLYKFKSLYRLVDTKLYTTGSYKVSLFIIFACENNLNKIHFRKG